MWLAGNIGYCIWGPKQNNRKYFSLYLGSQTKQHLFFGCVSREVALLAVQIALLFGLLSDHLCKGKQFLS